jgi:transcriptional regulator with XRE-family HTH domain
MPVRENTNDTEEKEVTQMVIEYGKLLGRIREKGFTQEQLANLVGMTPGTMSMKLNNQAYFKQKEIIEISDALGIPYSEIGEYFFVREVRKNTN